MENVQPVTVHTDPNSQHGDSLGVSKQEMPNSNPSPSPRGREAIREMEKEQKRVAEAEVIRMLTTQWLVRAEQIKVQWE